MNENTVEQPTIRERRIEQLRPYQFKKGESGNPFGRYGKGGKSGKERAKQMIANMTDDEFETFLHGIDKHTIWEMAEGKAQTNTDITSGGKPLIIPSEIIDKNDTTPDTENSSEGQV
jgi:hypothetical protein